MSDPEYEGGREGVRHLGHVDGWERGIGARRAHSTPDPDSDPPRPSPNPDDVPPPANAPVQEPTLPEPPIKARPIFEL
jgi:hypothetical protein